MSKSQNTVVNYLAAFLTAVVLHAGLAAGLGRFLSFGTGDVAVTENNVHTDALVLTFYQPRPAEPQWETMESTTRSHEKAPVPEPEVSAQDPALENQEISLPAENEAEESLKPLLPPPPSEANAQSRTAARQLQRQNKPLSTVNIEKPRPLQPINAEAVYPLGSRLRGEEGAVRIFVRIGADGRVGDLEIRESSGFTALDRAAERAVRRTRFAPATRDSRPVPGELTITIRFSLDS